MVVSHLYFQSVVRAKSEYAVDVSVSDSQTRED
jgi:hypothetical protein